MTRTSATYVNNNASSLSAYRGCAGVISAQLNAVLPRTADTGQVNFTTITTAPSRTANRDYELFAFTDALQATKPIIVRAQYGNDGMGLSVGTGSTGTGAITGATTVGLDLQPFYTFSSTGLTRLAYASSDGSYLTLLLNAQQPSGVTVADALTGIVIERTRDADGTANGDGICLWRWTASQSSAVDAGASAATTPYGESRNRIYDPAATQPGPHFELGAPALNMNNTTSWSNGPTAYTTPAYGSLGNIPYGASKAVMLGQAADFARLQVYPITHYGTTMQFLSLSGAAPQIVPYSTSVGTPTSKTMAPLVRWE